MDVNEQERLSNITLRHKLKKQFVVRKDMDVNEHERLSISRVHLHPYPFLLQAVPLTFVKV
jgi:predicted RNA-binding protein with PUA-like domain